MINLMSDMQDGNDGASVFPDLTTLLDILFILLVFFILTAGAAYRSLDLTLPSAVSEELASPPVEQHIMLEIRNQGYALDGEYFASFKPLKALISKAVQKNPDHNFIVAGDKDVSLNRFLEILTYLQSRGIEAANILMKSESPQ